MLARSLNTKSGFRSVSSQDQHPPALSRQSPGVSKEKEERPFPSWHAAKTLTTPLCLVPCRPPLRWVPTPCARAARAWSAGPRCGTTWRRGRTTSRQASTLPAAAHHQGPIQNLTPTGSHFPWPMPARRLLLLVVRVRHDSRWYYKADSQLACSARALGCWGFGWGEGKWSLRLCWGEGRCPSFVLCAHYQCLLASSDPSLISALKS